METGTLIFDSFSDRLSVILKDDIVHLHCGDCFDLWNPTEREWEPVRTEYSESKGWYLINWNKGFLGLTARGYFS